MYTLQFLLLVVLSVTKVHNLQAPTPDATSEKVRLSDFPVIKRWEIPLKANVVGRRHKDLFAENNKKRSFWEAKPQFTLHELEADEDPEKIYMDLHYSRNMLEDDNDDKTLFTSNKKSTISSTKNTKGQQKEASQQKKKVVAHQSGDKKRLIALKPFLSGKHVTIANKKRRKRRHRRSIESDNDEKEMQDGLEEEENLTENNNSENVDSEEEGLTRSSSAFIGEENSFENNNNDSNNVEEERVKRSSPSLADFYFDQYDNNDNMEESESINAPKAETDDDTSAEETNQPTGFIESQQKQREDEEVVTNAREKRSIITSSNIKQQKNNNNKNKKIASGVMNDHKKEKRTSPHEENISKIFKKTGPSSMNSKVHSSSPTGDNKRSTTIAKTSAETTDQQKKAAKALIQKAFFSTSKHGSNRIIPAATPSKNTVRHIIPPSSTMKHIPNVDVKFVTKSISSNGDNVEMTSLKKNADVGTRQQIAHPLAAETDVKNEKSSSDSINTANVARAVAVAMEQLKRDKMWGKVFVHVRPTGELKVMVQETKKMDE